MLTLSFSTFQMSVDVQKGESINYNRILKRQTRQLTVWATQYGVNHKQLVPLFISGCHLTTARGEHV